MDYTSLKPTSICHVVAMPSPGRGNINPMMNLCKLLASKQRDILVTFVVTEEWLTFIGSDPKPDNVRFSAIPNVLPSELVRAADMNGFYEAVLTKMEAPFEQILDQLVPPATLIIADSYLPWAVGIGNRRNIPVASFFPMSTMMFSVFKHFDLFVRKGHYPCTEDLLGKGDEFVDYIPGLSPINLKDLSSYLPWNQHNLARVMEAFSLLPKAQYLLFQTIYELEPHVIDILRSKFSFPVYTIGPAIPYFKLEDNSTSSTATEITNYFRWLDDQPSKSVLYISFGSFLSVSSSQMDEFAAGLRESGARFLWVARDKTSELKEICGDMGLVVPWCDQLRVLRHPSIGGFLSHCGWSSVTEGIYAGVAFLTFPIAADQIFNSKLIVEDWKIGCRVKKNLKAETLVTREEIAKVVHVFMDLESNEEGKEMRRRAKELQEICQNAIAEGGSSESNISNFIKDISCHVY